MTSPPNGTTNRLAGATSIVIFGDSYSLSLPIGDSAATWVSYLRALDAFKDIPIRSFAFKGATVENDLEAQVSSYFSTLVVLHDQRSSNSKTISYVFFFGVNDCGTTEEAFLPESIETIFEIADRLYTKAGARRFIFFDAPPVDRSPEGIEFSELLQQRVNTWNHELERHVSDFMKDTPMATVHCFSIHALISDILDNPEDYGFTGYDTMAEGGSIWADDLHLTSDVHSVISKQIIGK